jgi:hypothetical protein
MMVFSLSDVSDSTVASWTWVFEGSEPMELLEGMRAMLGPEHATSVADSTHALALSDQLELSLTVHE